MAAFDTHRLRVLARALEEGRRIPLLGDLPLFNRMMPDLELMRLGNSGAPPRQDPTLCLSLADA